MGLALPFLLAYLLDLLLGDPPGWPHPVRLLGSIIQYWESVLYRDRVGAGALFWLAVMATTGVLMLGVLGVAALLPPWGGIAVLAYFLYTGLATRSLHHGEPQGGSGPGQGRPGRGQGEPFHDRGPGNLAPVPGRHAAGRD